MYPKYIMPFNMVISMKILKKDHSNFLLTLNKWLRGQIELFLNLCLLVCLSTHTWECLSTHTWEPFKYLKARNWRPDVSELFSCKHWPRLRFTQFFSSLLRAKTCEVGFSGIIHTITLVSSIWFNSTAHKHMVMLYLS